MLVEAWLEGHVDTPESEPDPLDHVHYWYGAYRSPKGKTVGFMVKRQESIPTTALIVREGVGCVRVREAMQTLLGMVNAIGEIETPNVEPPPLPRGRPMKAGALATLSDSDGVHLGAIIDVLGNDVAMLVLTSRPGWNPQARRASADDVFALNVRNKRPTFLAPVIRDRANVFLRDGELGPLRLADFRAEFDWIAARRV